WLRSGLRQGRRDRSPISYGSFRVSQVFTCLARNPRASLLRIHRFCHEISVSKKTASERDCLACGLCDKRDIEVFCHTRLLGPVQRSCSSSPSTGLSSSLA